MLLILQRAAGTGIISDMRGTLLIALGLVACSSNGGSTPIQPATADIPAVSPTASGVAVPSSSAEPVPDAAPLRFVWTDFHFEMGTSVMEVEGPQVTETFSDHRMKTDAKGERYSQLFHCRASYRLTKGEASRLRAALTSDAFWALEPKYMHPGIDDGTTQTFTVALGDRKKDVYCYHQWPPPVADVRGIVRDIRKAHETERKASPEVDHREVEAAKERAKAAAKRAGRTMP